MSSDDSLEAWSFDLPNDRIATRPPERRSDSRLLHLPLSGSGCEDRGIRDLVTLLRPGDRLVVNNTRVMAARLHGARSTGGRVEFVVLSPGPGPIPALARPAKKLKVGDVIALDSGDTVTIVTSAVEGVLTFLPSAPIEDIMERAGELPLPPYMERPADVADSERYQTVYAGPLGAAAAPTAGLHFDESLLAELAGMDVGLTRVTLHVGLGTFRPLRPEDIARGSLHSESTIVTEQAATEIAATRAAGGRIIAVGTTSARTLESATPMGAAAPEPGQRDTTLFIRPPYTFRGLDGLLTNFHLPRSSLLMLVASLCGKDRLFAAYQHAIHSGYRFYSYGDAMLLL